VDVCPDLSYQSYGVFKNLSSFFLPGVGSEVPVKSTCLHLAKEIPVKNIKSYMIKEGSTKKVM
jgi:hypothetical protein